MVKICNCRRDRKLSQCRVTSSPYSALLSGTILWGSRAPTADRWAEGANLWIGHAFWPISPRPWTRNCFCATNTWLPKIGILKAQLQGRLRLSDTGRVTLGEIGHRLGRKALGEVATAALPDTILGRTESSSPANSMDRVHVEPRAGRRSAKKSRKLIIRMAKENRSCGYDRIVGALANLGHQVSDQTVGNVLRRHGIPSAPERRRTTTWAEFIRAHLAVAGGNRFFHGGGPHAARTGDLLCAVLHPFARRAHSARCLKFDQTIATVTYPFHPLVGQSVSIVGCHDHGGTYHLVIRKPDGAKCLIPEWMTRPEAEAIRILSSPRLSVNLPIELRDLIDRIMLTSPVEKRISGGRSSDTSGAAKIGAIQNITLGRPVATATKGSVGAC
jgi:Family of unknown function (DUF5372)